MLKLFFGCTGRKRRQSAKVKKHQPLATDLGEGQQAGVEAGAGAAGAPVDLAATVQNCGEIKSSSSSGSSGAMETEHDEASVHSGAMATKQQDEAAAHSSAMAIEHKEQPAFNSTCNGAMATEHDKQLATKSNYRDAMATEHDEIVAHSVAAATEHDEASINSGTMATEHDEASVHSGAMATKQQDEAAAHSGVMAIENDEAAYRSSDQELLPSNSAVEDEETVAQQYPMRADTSASPALALIFNYHTEEDSSRSACCGTEWSLAKLLRHRLGFNVHRFNDFTREELLAELQIVAGVNHDKWDSLLVVLVQHTSKSSGEPKRDSITPMELLDPFVQASSPGGSLHGKPKLFFILQHQDNAQATLLTENITGSSALPICEDFLICSCLDEVAATGHRNGCSACNSADLMARTMLNPEADLAGSLAGLGKDSSPICTDSGVSKYTVISTLTKGLFMPAAE